MIQRIAGLVVGALVGGADRITSLGRAGGGALGSLSQLPSPNNCIGTMPECGIDVGCQLAGSQAVVVSPDGKNVYMVDGGSVSEFSRNANGSLAELPAPNDCIGAGTVDA